MISLGMLVNKSRKNMLNTFDGSRMEISLVIAFVLEEGGIGNASNLSGS
jgi:galactokinase